MEKWVETKRKPTAFDLQIFMRLSGMLNVLQTEQLPISLIFYKGTKKSIFDEKEKTKFYLAFERVARRFDLFDTRMMLAHETKTNKNRWIYRLKPAITKEEFEKILKVYAKKHFKKEIFPDPVNP